MGICSTKHYIPSIYGLYCPSSYVTGCPTINSYPVNIQTFIQLLNKYISTNYTCRVRKTRRYITTTCIAVGPPYDQHSAVSGGDRMPCVGISARCGPSYKSGCIN